MIFGKKNVTTATAEKPVKDDLPGPKDNPSQIASRMITQMDVDSKLAYALKAVMRPINNNPNTVEVRLYKQNIVDYYKLKVKNFNSFDDHQNLVLFEGTWDKKNMILNLEDRRANKNKLPANG